MASPKISKTSQFWVVLRLFSKYYWKSFFGPFFNFVFAPLIYSILGAIMGWQVMLPGVMAMVGVSIGIQLVPFTIIGLKKSVLLKRIGASPVKPSMFTFVMCFFFLVVVVLSSLWLSLCALLISLDPDIYDSLLSVKGAFGYIQGLLVNILLSISLGFVITSFSKSEIQAQALGLLVFLPVAFLSGQFLSPAVIASSEVMEWMSRLIPFRYSTMMMSESWTGDINIPKILDSSANIWSVHEYVILSPINFSLEEINQITQNSGNLNSFLEAKIEGAKTVLYDKADHIVSFVYPYVSGAIFLFVGIKSFKWSASR